MLAAAAAGGPVTVTAEPIDFPAPALHDGIRALLLAGGLTLTSEDEDFGGFSGLVLGKDCEDMVAVSDRGNWLTAKAHL